MLVSRALTGKYLTVQNAGARNTAASCRFTRYSVVEQTQSRRGVCYYRQTPRSILRRPDGALALYAVNVCCQHSLGATTMEQLKTNVGRSDLHLSYFLLKVVGFYSYQLEG